MQVAWILSASVLFMLRLKTDWFKNSPFLFPSTQNVECVLCVMCICLGEISVCSTYHTSIPMGVRRGLSGRGTQLSLVIVISILLTLTSSSVCHVCWIISEDATGYPVRDSPFPLSFCTGEPPSSFLLRDQQRASSSNSLWSFPLWFPQWECRLLTSKSFCCSSFSLPLTPLPILGQYCNANWTSEQNSFESWSPLSN